MDCMFNECDRVLKDKAFLQLQETEDNYYKKLKEQQQQQKSALSSSWFGDGGGKTMTPVENIPPISSLSNPLDAQTLANMEEFILAIENKLKDFPEETAKWVNQLAVTWSKSEKEGGKEEFKTKVDMLWVMHMAQVKQYNPLSHKDNPLSHKDKAAIDAQLKIA